MMDGLWTVLLTIGLNLQGFVVPQEFEGRPVIARDLGVEMEKELSPSVQRYSACLRERSPSQQNAMNIVKDARRAIKLCAAVRAEAIAEADTALAEKPGWRDRERRLRSINTTFTQVDASHLHLAEETSAWFREQMKQLRQQGSHARD